MISSVSGMLADWLHLHKSRLNACRAVHESPPERVVCRSIGHVTGTLTAPEVGNRSGVGDGPATYAAASSHAAIADGWRHRRARPVGREV